MLQAGSDTCHFLSQPIGQNRSCGLSSHRNQEVGSFHVARGDGEPEEGRSTQVVPLVNSSEFTDV